jgi:hypothetical protein
MVKLAYWKSSGVALGTGLRLAHQLRQLSNIRSDPPRLGAHLSVLRVAFPVFVRDYLRRSRPRVQVTKASVTTNHIRIAGLECAVLAVPVHVFSEVYDCAPGGIAIRARLDEVPNHVVTAKAVIPMVSFAKVFATTIPPLPLLMSNEHRNGKINPRKDSGSLAILAAVRRASLKN